MSKWLEKTDDLNLNVFNMLTRINETRTSTKHVSYKCECKFDGRNWKNDGRM